MKKAIALLPARLKFRSTGSFYFFNQSATHSGLVASAYVSCFTRRKYTDLCISILHKLSNLQCRENGLWFCSRTAGVEDRISVPYRLSRQVQTACLSEKENVCRSSSHSYLISLAYSSFFLLLHICLLFPFRSNFYSKKRTKWWKHTSLFSHSCHCLYARTGQLNKE